MTNKETISEGFKPQHGRQIGKEQAGKQPSSGQKPSGPPSTGSGVGKK